MGEVIAIAVFVLGTVVFWYTMRRVEAIVGRVLFPWLRPLIEMILPIFKFTPWLFERVEGADIPDPQRRFFETHTATFLARRFTSLGDYVLRRDGGKLSCSRFFLSPDGKVIGALTCYLGSHTIECMSVLLDGLYLETSNMPCGRLPPKKHGLQFFIISTQDPSQVIDHHLDCVAKAAAESKSEPAPLTADDVRAVSNYGRELSLRSLFQQGVLAELPEFLRVKQPAAISFSG